MRSYCVGDTVCWVSHGGSASCKKRGIIICIIPAGDRVHAHGPNCRFQHSTRPEESYIVEVTTKTGRKLRYHPRTKDLRKSPKP